MSLGGKYVFAIVMFLFLPMCILISCSSVLCSFCVTFVSCIVMMSGWMLCTRFFSSSILFLMPFMLI